MTGRNLVVLLYGLSGAMLAINAAFTIAFVEVILINTVSYVQSYVGASATPFIAPGSLADLLNYPVIHYILGGNYHDFKALFFKIEASQVWGYS